MKTETLVKLRKQMELHERREHFPYRDTQGILTIGIGRNLENVGLRDREIDFLLDTDIVTAITDCYNLLGKDVYESLSDIRKRVIVDMVFNMGLSRFSKFKKMLAAVEAKDWNRAADEMVDSLWYKQTKTRAVRLVKMMRTGEDYSD